MKKLLISIVILGALGASISAAEAHGYRGGRGGAWIPFAAGTITGVVISNAYQRPPPVYYGLGFYYPMPPPVAVAYCPENGLYYPQTEACPSGWQRVPH